MKNLSFCLFAFIILSTCSSKYELVEKHDDNGVLTESFKIDKESGFIEGEHFTYFPSGKVEQKADYKENKLDGKRILFYESGDTLIIESYKNSQYVGIYKSFYPGGLLESEGQYESGMMNGEWNFYYDNKQLKEVVAFKGNEENGPFVEYHKNGKMKAKGTYKTTEKNIDGNREHGPLELFDENGVLVKKMDCNLGICKTTWKKEES